MTEATFHFWGTCPFKPTLSYLEPWSLLAGSQSKASSHVESDDKFYCGTLFSQEKHTTVFIMAEITKAPFKHPVYFTVVPRTPTGH